MSNKLQKNTEPVTQNEFFEGVPIRILTYQGIPYIPVVDIATGIGYDRKNLSKVIESHGDMLKDNCAYLPIQTKGGMQNALCVNRDGIIAVFMGLQINRIKDTSKKSLILTFRKWALDTLGKAMDGKVGEIQPFAAQSEQQVSVRKEIVVGDLLSDHLQIADALAKFANVDRGIAVNMAMALVEFKTGVDLTAYKGLIKREKQNDDVGMLIPTELGQELGGLNASTINSILKKLGYQTWINNSWVLTERGKRHAEVFPVVGFTDSGKSYARFQIKWQPQMVDILRKHIFDPMPDPKDGLLSGFLGA